jgi:transcriptional regulator with XRE-family HTH domain
MKSFGQVIVAARKAAGLTQKYVAESLRRGDGRPVLPPFLNDLEHDRRYPPENEVIYQLADILKLSSDVLYFYAKRVPPDVRRNATDDLVEPALERFVRLGDDLPDLRQVYNRRSSSRAGRYCGFGITQHPQRSGIGWN